MPESLQEEEEVVLRRSHDNEDDDDDDDEDDDEDEYRNDEDDEFGSDEEARRRKTIKGLEGVMRRKTDGKNRAWDAFRDLPPLYESGSMADTKLFDVSVEIMRIVAFLVTFVVVLAGGAISKTMLVMMTSQLNTSRAVTVCGSDGKMSTMTIPDLERYTWIWALLLAYTIPEFGTFLRSARMCYFKSYIVKVPDIPYMYLTVFLAETLHVIGMAIFVFEVLPQLDAVRGVMLTNCVCIIPGILRACSHVMKQPDSKFKVITDAVAVGLQITSFFLWPGIDSRPREWLILLSLLLMSFGWWMNFVSKESQFSVIKYLASISDCFKDKEIVLYKAYLFISIWKIALFFCTTLIILAAQGTDVVDFFQSTQDAFNGSHAMNSTRLVVTHEDPIEYMLAQGISVQVQSSYWAVWFVLLAQVLGAYFCYIFGKFACKVLIQEFSFALSTMLVVPVSVIVIVVATGFRNEDACRYNFLLPNYLFFATPDFYYTTDIFTTQHSWMWVFWLLSQIWLTHHIWFPLCNRRSKTEVLFATPMYSGILVDQSLVLNRRRDEAVEEQIDNFKVPNIIACATMWHESKAEMLGSLKAIFRMDNDQCQRRVIKDIFYNKIPDPNYYNFETHIFFDDAFELDVETELMVVNPFVKDFVGCMNKAARSVHQSNDVKVASPVRIPTPYGGRLEFTLPGETKMYVHLKDKAKIRHRKRWSQVMYMYYLLGFKIMEIKDLTPEQRMEKAHNTFLLALDGDIDFKPKAVHLLVDLMKKDNFLGAACGRIHPVGSGLMAWYQLFEYAIGHWLQKATEHMIGCVLCSPGCFSLFRGEALMDDNVMRKYTTKAEEPRHYVQYDQGEDRWLCTLLLQRGYRVEYCAASDAYTHCPEAFNEFYTQRRRWVPSTMANILDLLEDYKHTIRINNNISFPYICYQMMLMAGTILGPGTIFLMLVGAFNAAFKIDNWTAFAYNLVPIALFILICFFCSQNFQLLSALIISTIYGLIMMAVLVGILIEIQDDGVLAPSALFLFIVAGEIIVAGLFHPQEFMCLPSGAIYYVTIPSMYLLLIIYSLCNLNIVSWGTREVAEKKTKKQMEEEKKLAAEAQKKAKSGGLFGFLDMFATKNQNEDEGSIEFSLAGLFKCMLCTHKKPDDEKQQLIRIADSLTGLQKKIEKIERIVDPNAGMGRRTTSNSSISIFHRERPSTLTFEKTNHEDETGSEDESEEEEHQDDVEQRDELQNPFWNDDKHWPKGKVDFLERDEKQFWFELIKKYLYPLDEDKKQQAKIAKDLKELRDKTMLAFLMLNALFVTIIFLLQLNKDKIFIDWPLDAKSKISHDTDTFEINIDNDYLHLEPVGLVFVLFFALILVIQFTGMLFHRFETFATLISTATLTIFGSEKKFTSAQMTDNLVRTGKKMKREKQKEEEAQDNRKSMGVVLNEDALKHRKTILMLDHQVRDTRKKKAVSIREDYSQVYLVMKQENDQEALKREERRRSSTRFNFRRSTVGGRASGRPISGYKNEVCNTIDEGEEEP